MRTALLAATLATTLTAALASPAAFAQSPPISVTASTPTGTTDAMVSNLVGLDVYNGANEEVGEIKDLVLDSSMKVGGVVLSVGGFLGVGTKYIVVTPNLLTIAYDSTASKWKATTAATKEQMTAAPEFKYEGKFND